MPIGPTKLAAVVVIVVSTLIAPTARSIAQQATPPASAAAPKMPSVSAEAAKGHRLWLLLFDLSSIQPDDLPRAQRIARQWIDERMGVNELVAVLTAGASLHVLQDFTDSTRRVREAVDGLQSSAAAGGEVTPAAEAPPDERDLFNNDLRFREIRQLCSGLTSVITKKAIVFFTVTRERPGPDNQVEARATADACSRVNVSINPIDVGIPR